MKFIEIKEKKFILIKFDYKEIKKERKKRKHPKFVSPPSLVVQPPLFSSQGSLNWMADSGIYIRGKSQG